MKKLIAIIAFFLLLFVTPQLSSELEEKNVKLPTVELSVNNVPKEAEGFLNIAILGLLALVAIKLSNNK